MNIKSEYIRQAATLHMGDFTAVKTGKERAALVTKCADAYCKARDESDESAKNKYISALMLLFWGEIGKMAEKCKGISTLEYDDFVFTLYNCIEVACGYRAWQNKDGVNAEQCIRQAIASRGAAALLYDSNLDKSKANVNAFSLDDTIEGKDGEESSRIDFVESDDPDPSEACNDTAQVIVQKCIDKNKIVEAIILDSIAYGDSQRVTTTTHVGHDAETGEEYKYKTESSEFWSYQLVRTLASLDDSYMKYFKRKYEVDDLVFDSAFAKIKASNNNKLYKYINSTLQSAKVFAKDF